MTTRRRFLKNAALVSLAPVAPMFLTRMAEAAASVSNAKTLVVIQMNGGNDGINTVVPFGDEGYAKNRDALRLDKKDLLKINDQLGFHSAMRGAADLLESGRLAVVQGVGYPNPNRSHFRSMAIWHTARFDEEQHTGSGWLGRACDLSHKKGAQRPQTIFAGSEKLPVALWSRRSVSTSLSSLDDLSLTLPVESFSAQQPTAPQADLAQFVQRSVLDAYATSQDLSKKNKGAAQSAINYPGTKLAERMKLIAQLIKAGTSAPIYYTTQGGYDTHAGQLYPHSQLLREFSGALKAFLDDLKEAKQDDGVLVMAFSEFGRRVKENASLGTDHGTAGPLFIAGKAVKAGVIGKTPSLTELDSGDVKMSVDFRQVYATLLEKWLGIASEKILDGKFEHLPLV